MNASRNSFWTSKTNVWKMVTNYLSIYLSLEPAYALLYIFNSFWTEPIYQLGIGEARTHYEHLFISLPDLLDHYCFREYVTFHQYHLKLLSSTTNQCCQPHKLDLRSDLLHVIPLRLWDHFRGTSHHGVLQKTNVRWEWQNVLGKGLKSEKPCSPYFFVTAARS